MPAATGHRAEESTRTIPPPGDRTHVRSPEQLEGLRIIADIRNQAYSHKQADAGEVMIRYLARAEYHEGGDRVLRSIPQIAKGLGKPVSDLTMRQIRDHWENSITNSLAFLERLGYVDHVERNLRHPDGQGIGILIHLPAGVAQSVRAARKLSQSPVPRRPSCDVRAAAPQPGSFVSHHFAPPRRGVSGNCDVVGESGRKERLLRASAQRLSADASKPPGLSHVRAALEAALLSASLDGGGTNAVELLQRRPELSAAPPSLLARAAWAAAGHPDLRLSPPQREQLETAGRQLERSGYGSLPPGSPSAAAAAIIDLAFGGWAEFWDRATWQQKRPSPAVTPGALAICVRRLAHEQLKAWRARRARRQTSTAGSRG